MSTTIRSARRMRAMALLTVSSARCRRSRTPRFSSVNQATWRPASTACCPRASRRNVFPVPEGPHTTRFSRLPIHSRVRSACWVGAGMEDSSGCQAWNVFPVGNPAAARRVARAERARAAGFFGEQGLQDLGWVPALAFGGGDHLWCQAADVGQAEPAQQLVELGRQRRRRGNPCDWCGTAGHWWTSLPAP